MKERKHCNQPDRDFPKMKCGYPLPCPWHTIIIKEGIIENPEILNKKTAKRIKDIADALKGV